MTVASASLSAAQIVLIALGAVIVLVVGAALLGRALMRRGRRIPVVVRVIDSASERLVNAIKGPVTLAVLDQVAEVMEEGRYTRNIAAALRENHDAITQLLAEKIKQDPTGRHLELLPFHDRLIREAGETTLRVLLEMLADPRTDELFSDLLRDNITQLREAVHANGGGRR
jgi:hypothetical protein